MGAGHNHAEGHGHAEGGGDFSRAFALGILLNLAFVAIEATYAWSADSMALFADAGHNLSDVMGLVIAWGGAAIAKRTRSPRFSFGLKKASILAALINALILLVAVGAIAAEAIRRFAEPAPTQGKVVMIVAGIGIAVNAATAWLFARGRKGDINVRGAFLHMVADAAVSAAVVVSGFAILITGKQWIDPAISLLIAAVIFWSTFGLLKESVGMSLAGVPANVSLDGVERALLEIGGVAEVHDLHIWALSTTETALTVHLVAPHVEDTDALLRAAQAMLHDRFAILHSTIQLEREHLGDAEC